MEYLEDGTLESRLYLSQADKGDTGQYSCHIPGLDSVSPAIINLHIFIGNLMNFTCLKSKFLKFMLTLNEQPIFFKFNEN